VRIARQWFHEERKGKCRSAQEGTRSPHQRRHTGQAQATEMMTHSCAYGKGCLPAPTYPLMWCACACACAERVRSVHATCPLSRTRSSATEQNEEQRRRPPTKEGGGLARTRRAQNIEEAAASGEAHCFFTENNGPMKKTMGLPLAPRDWTGWTGAPMSYGGIK
jgi:hypothetical protein